MQNYCARCDEAVYFAEAVQAMGSFYHKKCFVCSREPCGRSLDSRTCSEHEGKPYCTHCYKSMFGPKGVGYGIGSGVLSTNAPDETTRQIEHGKMLPFTSTISYGTNDDDYVRKQDAPIPLVRAPVAAPRPMICKKCQKTVYEAEKVLAAGAVWHKSGCFNCSDCNKRLESRTQCEQGGKLYCNACYGRQFGPRGYGHGVGAGLLQLYQ
ncbi:unnamed protein product, partial [Mesorhabditis spiculigera]